MGMWRSQVAWWRVSFVEMNDNNLLGTLNNRPDLDSSQFLNHFIIDEDNDFNIFNDIHLSSNYFNIETFVSICRSEKNPL